MGKQKTTKNGNLSGLIVSYIMLLLLLLFEVSQLIVSYIDFNNYHNSVETYVSATESTNYFYEFFHGSGIVYYAVCLLLIVIGIVITLIKKRPNGYCVSLPIIISAINTLPNYNLLQYGMTQRVIILIVYAVTLMNIFIIGLGYLLKNNALRVIGILISAAMIPFLIVSKLEMMWSMLSYIPLSLIVIAIILSIVLLAISCQKDKKVSSNCQDASKGPSQFDNVNVLREYKKLLDDGVVTAEEFEKKKRELLS